MIRELEELCKKYENSEILQNRKEFRKYIEEINEKDAENKNLKRQIQSFKNRITSLEQDINNLEGIKENYEIFVIKSIDQIKSGLK